MYVILRCALAIATQDRSRSGLGVLREHGGRWGFHDGAKLRLCGRLGRFRSFEGGELNPLFFGSVSGTVSSIQKS
jgi:hypothetical protein